MDNKTVVFHVGAHKTGTSLLQKYMRDNRRRLQMRGIYYLARSDMNDLVGWGRPLVEHPEKLADRVSDVLGHLVYQTLVTSHENTLGRPVARGGEHLYPGCAPMIEALGGVLAPYRAKVFLYVRPQVEFIESYYLQLIHQGNTFTFDEWLDTLDMDRVSWVPLTEKLMETFGRDRVEIVDFGEIRLGQNEFIQRFFRRIDPGFDFEVDYKPRRNPSVGDKGLTLALAANPHLNTGDEKKAMRVFLQKNFSNVAYPRPVLFTEAQRQAVRDRYDDEYRRITGTA
ncbi:MAG: hypothetical protein M5U31_15995 [Acidimicrobiia bacterium]|nr:hypothetical protein [Acidimicrobiia bacterium]